MSLPIVSFLALVATALAAGASVTFSPSIIPSTGSMVTVKWSGVSSPNTDDVLQVQVTTASGVSLLPLGWFPVNTTSTWSTGSGMISMPLMNMRGAQYSFAYMQVCCKYVLVSGLQYVSAEYAVSSTCVFA